MLAPTAQLLITLVAAAPASLPPDAPPWDRIAHYVWPDDTPPRVQPPEKEPPKIKPRWVVHRVIAHEKIERIAVRYGVTVREIMRTNKLDKPEVRWKQRLRIFARRWPEPKQETKYTSQAGDTWVSVSVAHSVRYRDLRAWNWMHGGDLEPGKGLSIWVEPEDPITVYRKPGPPMPQVVVPEGGESVGKPQRGRLDSGVRIPDTALFDLRWPETTWGSSHAVRVVMESVARFRHDSGWPGRLVLGALSRRRGRCFPPHNSHRTGRDIDVFLPLNPGVRFTYEPTEWEVDWHASWALAMAFLESGEVVCLYLDQKLHRYLFEAGRQLGATPEQLAALVEWPNGDGPRRGIPIRHGVDHYRHFHIRIRCGPNEPRCRAHPWEDRVPRTFPLPASWGQASADPWKEPPGA